MRGSYIRLALFPQSAYQLILMTRLTTTSFVLDEADIRNFLVKLGIDVEGATLSATVELTDGTVTPETSLTDLSVVLHVESEEDMSLLSQSA